MHERVRDLVARALDLQGADRDAFLRRECGADHSLEHAVRTLLQFEHDIPGILTAGGAFGSMSETRPSDEVPPAAAGSGDASSLSLPGYRVTQRLGAGGMGVVFEAEQLNPRRPVALKVIRGGSYVTDHVVRLFQREAQALARLRHPSIAAIYESGRTTDGQHFFAMELIQGQDLSTFVRDLPLSGPGARQNLETLLRIFLRIADAISYAHQRGVLHRDLKPSNIMVSRPSDSGRASGDASSHPELEVKILDFGLARITEHDVGLETMVTTPGQVQGTLPYMSPEQARGDSEAIDTRSDVYSLGVILHELLTGDLPIDVSDAPIHEAIRRICETEPARAGKDSREVDSDLKTIVLKSLEKDPNRRYHSVGAMADDVERYLADQPILARAPSTFYQIRKLVKRNRLPATFAGTVVLFLIGFAITMGVLRGRADAARGEAEAVVTFLSDMLGAVNPDESGRDVTVREVLDEAAGKVGAGFADEPLVEAQIRFAMGRSYRGLGEFDAAEEQFRTAVAIRRDQLGENDRETLSASNSLGWTYQKQGRYEQAASVLGETLEQQRRVLGSDDPATLDTMNNLAGVFSAAGEHDKAAGLFGDVLEARRRIQGPEHPKTLAARNNLASARFDQRKYEEAEELYRDTLETLQRVLGPEHPTSLTAMVGLANSCQTLGRQAESDSLTLAVLETRRRVLGDEHPDTLASENQLAVSYARQRRYPESAGLFRQVIEAKRSRLGSEHPETLFSMADLALLYVRMGKLAESEALGRECVGVMERVLGEEHPRTSGAMENLAVVCSLEGRQRDSEALHRRVLDARRHVLGEDHPQTNQTRCNLACATAMQGRGDEAVALLRDALDNGYRDPDVWIAQDSDLASLHGNPEFEAIVAELRRRNDGGKAPAE
ncbi:tetratricopeptide repeat protein [bacterium]|nr:tetratricopeptide repeat protein [bacterium]